MHCIRGRCLRWLRLLWLTVAILVCASASGCARRGVRPPATARDVLDAMLGEVREEVAPDGEIYEGDGADHGTLVSALYGEGSRRWFDADGETLATVDEVAMFLPCAMHPMEIAVFRCPDATRGARDVAAACRARLSVIENAWADTEYASWIEAATVSVEGQFVILAVYDDPDVILQAARAVIKRGG